MQYLDAHMTTLLGRRWKLFLLWYAEACVALAAIWALSQGADLPGVARAFAYLLVCGVALGIPGHALRLGLARLGVPPARRRAALQILLALAAALTAATLGTARGWAAIVFILLTGNALWALEMEARATADEPKE
jgi:NhaP-type Na+/H+ or K+/H+ antiporter